MTVTTSAPGKLMLLGEHAVVYGHPCVVTAVSRRMWVSVERATDGLVHMSSPALGVDDWKVPLTRVCVADSPRGVRFLQAAVCAVAQRHRPADGLRIVTHSSFLDELGLGSSAAVTIATIEAVSGLMELELSRAALLTLAHKAVLSVQGVGSGFDLAASIYGGTLYYRRPPGADEETARGSHNRSVDILPLSPDPLPLIVGYSGSKADTASLVRRVARRRKQQPGLVGEIFDGMARLVENGRGALLARDWPRLGQAMSLSQSLLDALGVSTPKLAQLVCVAEEAGAHGAKLSGAGGGDCMIALVSEEQRADVIRAINAAGGEVIPLRTAEGGIRRERGLPTCASDSIKHSPSTIR